MSEPFSDETIFAVKLARIDELIKLRELLSKMDREWDQDYLRCCEAGSEIGAAQVVGKREAGAKIRGIIRERIEEVQRE